MMEPPSQVILADDAKRLGLDRPGARDHRIEQTLDCRTIDRCRGLSVQRVALIWRARAGPMPDTAAICSSLAVGVPARIENAATSFLT